MAVKKQKLYFIFFGLLAIDFALLIWFLLTGNNIAIFNPKGEIAVQQRDLIVTAILLMFIIVIPMLVMTFFFAWKYRAENKQAKYTPQWDHSTTLEVVRWTALCAIILILAVIAWQSSHALDPIKPIVSSTEPITIQVVALQWKWLFIYPKQNIAAVNFVQFPQNTPINFEITADAPMNSFWIPQLGGQMYAMNGMRTKLHLIADEIGEYRGFSANISGEGFAGMNFTAKASSQADFTAWVETVKFYGNNLDVAGYEQLALPSQNNEVAYFRPQTGLFDSIIMKFTAH